MIQQWKRLDSYYFCVKPLPGNKIVDLMGQVRQKESSGMYFASDQTILVNFQNERPLVLDIHGFVIEQLDFKLDRPFKVFTKAKISQTLNRFFLL